MVLAVLLIVVLQKGWGGALRLLGHLASRSSAPLLSFGNGLGQWCHKYKTSGRWLCLIVLTPDGLALLQVVSSKSLHELHLQTHFANVVYEFIAGAHATVHGLHAQVYTLLTVHQVEHEVGAARVLRRKLL